MRGAHALGRGGGGGHGGGGGGHGGHGGHGGGRGGGFGAPWWTWGGGGYWDDGGTNLVVVEPDQSSKNQAVDYAKRAMAHIMTLPKAQRGKAYQTLFGQSAPQGALGDARTHRRGRGRRGALGDATSTSLAATACNANPMMAWNYSTNTCGPVVTGPTLCPDGTMMAPGQSTCMPTYTCPATGVKVPITNLANPAALCPPPVPVSTDGTILGIPTTWALIGAAGAAYYFLVYKKRAA